MEYTENLNLPVLEDSDTMTSVFSQANAIAEQLENLFGDNLDDYQNLDQITADIATINGSLSALLNRTVVNEHDIDDLETSMGNANASILSLERLNNNINVDGQVVNGYLEKYVLSANAIGNVNTVDIGDGKYFHKDNGYLEINLTSALNISASESIIVESAAIYRNSTSNERIAPLSLHGCGGKTGSYGKYIVFTAANSLVNTSQESASQYDNVGYTVVLTILRESVE